MGAHRNQRNRRSNRTLREPTAGLPGRCFDDKMFADEGYQAPTAPMEFVPASDGPMDPHVETPNHHDAELRTVTMLPKPVRYTAISCGYSPARRTGVGTLRPVAELRQDE